MLSKVMVPSHQLVHLHLVDGKINHRASEDHRLGPAMEESHRVLVDTVVEMAPELLEVGATTPLEVSEPTASEPTSSSKCCLSEFYMLVFNQSIRPFWCGEKNCHGNPQYVRRIKISILFFLRQVGLKACLSLKSAAEDVSLASFFLISFFLTIYSLWIFSHLSPSSVGILLWIMISGLCVLSFH